MRTSLLLLALLAACTQEASITDPQCGNYVLDPGEDCDRPGSACNTSCRIVCTVQPPCQAQTNPPLPDSQCPRPLVPSQTTACDSADAIDGVCCPSGMACGVDGICHEPAAVLLPEHTAPFDSLTFSVTDVDGDYISDVVGVSRTDVLVGYGNAAAPLSTILQQPTPSPASTTAEVGFGDFDGDGHEDIVISASAGLFALDNASGTPAPLVFPVNGTAGQFNPGIVPNTTHEHVAPVYIGTFPKLVELDRVVAGAATTFQLVVVTTPTPPISGIPQLSFTRENTQPSLCGATFTKEDQVVRGFAMHPFLDTATIRVPLTLGQNTLCVATANPSVVDTSYAVNKAVIPAGYRFTALDGETFFANLMSPVGTCPDLVVPVYDASSTPKPFAMILKGSGMAGQNACSVDQVDPPTLLAGAPLAATALATTPPAPGLITSEGIYSYNGAWSAMPVTMPTRTWRYAAVADLDHDGKPDFATVGQGNDVEVFRQLDGTLGTPRWSDYLIETQDTVARIGLGNFDGDASGDVAIATLDASSTQAVAPADLAIAWGSADGSFSPQSYGAFAEPYDLSEVALFDSSLPEGVDSCDDLILARGGVDPTDVNDPALLVAEYGTTARTLAAPFAFVSSFKSTTPSRAHGITSLVGQFGAGGAYGVFAIFDSSTAPGFSMLNLTYNPYTAAFDASPEYIADPCSIDAAIVDSPFCVTSAGFFQLRRDNGGDLIFGYRHDTEGAPRAQCAEYYIADGGAPKMSTISCDDLAPAAASSTDPNVVAAFAALTGIDRVTTLHADGTTSLLFMATPNTVKGVNSNGMPVTMHPVAQAYLWQLTVTPDGKPQLGSPIAINPELAAADVLAPGTTGTCFSATSFELGKRVVNGTMYGDGSIETVLACTVGAPGRYRTELFTRFADPGGGPAHYELLLDLKTDFDLAMKAGDFDGNGLGDLYYETGTAGTGSRIAHVLLQADTHQVAGHD